VGVGSVARSCFMMGTIGEVQQERLEDSERIATDS
jgi:hypothetical protein